MSIQLIIVAAILLLISVLVSKISDRFGIPALILFLFLGMLAGSDGFGGIQFDDPSLAQFIGIIALVLILFSGGVSTEWTQVKPVLKEGLLLSTFGVLVTAVVVGFAASYLLGLSLIEGMLVGAIVSSTDAAAVFAVLRARGVSLKGKLAPLLELESGSNDPTAVFLTIGFIQLVQNPSTSPLTILVLFAKQMLIGAVIGFIMGKLMFFMINRIKLGHEGLYPVLTISLAMLTFGITDRLGGSGFLAVYLAGIVLGERDFLHQNSLIRFHDGLAWIMQIAMFLTLGLLVFPSRLLPVIGVSLLIAGCLMFIARPLSVFLTLIPSKLGWREKTFISWVGLRGAVPIVLATFPLIAKIPQADLIFNVVFFIVLTSVIFQGTTLTFVAEKLKVNAPVVHKRNYPLEYVPMSGLKGELKEFHVCDESPMVGKAIFELGLPESFLVVLIAREDDFIMPKGGTVLIEGDTLLVLSDGDAFSEVVSKYSSK